MYKWLIVIYSITSGVKIQVKPERVIIFWGFIRVFDSFIALLEHWNISVILNGHQIEEYAKRKSKWINSAVILIQL